MSDFPFDAELLTSKAGKKFPPALLVRVLSLSISLPHSARSIVPYPK